MNGRFGRIVHFLASPTLTVWLAGLFVLYYLTMAVWWGEAFTRYVTHLSTSNFFRAFYLLFLVNVTLRTAAHVRRMRGSLPVLFLRLPLLVGVVLVLAAFFLSLNVRNLQWTPPVGEGDPIILPWERASSRIVKVDPALSRHALRMDDGRIFDYEPGVTIIDREGRNRKIGAFPPRNVDGNYMHVLMFGLGPGVELKRGEESVWKGYVAQRLVPFGQVDSFQVPGLPYRFYLSVAPSEIVKKGRETARSYDLERPRYQVEVVQGDRILRKEETDRGLSFDGNMTLSFFRPSEWVIVEAARDPFLPWFAVSLLLFACGLLLYPFSWLFRRKDR